MWTSVQQGYWRSSENRWFGALVWELHNAQGWLLPTVPLFYTDAVLVEQNESALERGGPVHPS